MSIHASLRLTVAPATEPIDATEAKRNQKIVIAAADGAINDLIAEAREELEGATARAFVTQTWQLTLDRFPFAGCSDTYRPTAREIELRVCPVQSVSSIVYLDPAGESQTLSTSVYDVDTRSEPGRITLKNGQTWPLTLIQANAVTITFVAGYGDAAAVPRLVKRAIKMRVAHWYSYAGIALDARAKAGEQAWAALKQQIGWGAYP